ncbi:uncharacterized protein LOC141713440 [Apium graveolens]|uniref:uncharacterized protein LOC141713440 n=1 Tax=Apium graveolens TaxID=4045 RepID=UPI003D7BDA66
MTPAFFQRHWDIVGKDAINMMRHFFLTGDMLQGLNVTNVVLIPKKKNSTLIGDLRPISVCNVLAKIITKVIANRMKGMLDGVVTENQSAFILGRLITHNIMISFEIMHYLKRKRRGKEDCMALKLDMSKCVTSVTYTITHDGRELNQIIPTRDDVYLYCKENEEASQLLNMLNSFEVASRQNINLSKSSLFFSSNIIQSNKENICLQMDDAGDRNMYLDLPNWLARNKTSVLSFLKDKVSKCIQSWSGSLVSQSGKEILIKSVVQTTSSYVMSVFLLPLDLTKDIERSLMKYWWNSNPKKNLGARWLRNRLDGGYSWRNEGGKAEHGGGRAEAKLMEIDGKLSEISGEDSGVKIVQRDQLSNAWDKGSSQGGKINIGENITQQEVVIIDTKPKCVEDVDTTDIVTTDGEVNTNGPILNDGPKNLLKAGHVVQARLDK